MKVVQKVGVLALSLVAAIIPKGEAAVWDATDFIGYEPVEGDDVCRYVGLNDVLKTLTDNGFQFEAEGTTYDEMRQDYCRARIYRKSDVEQAVVYFHPEYEEMPMRVDIKFPDEEQSLAFCRNAMLKMVHGGDGMYFINGYVDSGVVLEIKGCTISLSDSGPM